MHSFHFPPQLPSIFFQPILYRPNGSGNWCSHIPFACDLIATLRPATLVDLVTHTGESYFAFCQAVAENKVECRSFAVDPWDGDQASGLYTQAKTHNEQHYGHFSTLLRLTLDEAVERFDQDSIDLLHIDGAHSYEAAVHHFDLWWPKVRPGGVVLLHNSFERRHGFGVWRLLEELRTAGLPAGDFFHGDGLGVLLKPPVAGDENVAAAFVTADDQGRRAMRNYYEVCAGHLQCQYLTDSRNHPAAGPLPSSSARAGRVAGQY